MVLGMKIHFITIQSNAGSHQIEISISLILILVWILTRTTNSILSNRRETPVFSFFLIEKFAVTIATFHTFLFYDYFNVGAEKRYFPLFPTVH